MDVRKVLLCGALLAASGTAAASLDIEAWTTDNGARVLFVETHELPMVQVSVAFDAGSARDPADRLGLAHLVNLMVEEGAGSLSGDEIANRLESVGAQLTSENGRDMSVFELRSLSDDAILTSATEVFAGILQQPNFPQSALERERQRVLVELRQQEQSPRDVVNRVFYSELFAGHAYAQPPSGNPDGVQAVTRDDLVRFHERYFVGRNAVLAVVGDLTRAQAEALVESIIGGLPAGDVPAPISRLPKTQPAEQVRVAFPSNQSHLMLGQFGVSREDPDYFPLYVGNHILGGSGLISRLAVEIREKRGLAYSSYSYFVPMREAGLFIIGLQTRNDQAELAEQVARDTVANFVTEGPTAEELEAAKKNITGGFPLRIDSNKKIAGNLLTMAFYDLPLDYLDTFSGRVEAVTVDQIRDAFRRRIDPQQMVRVVVGGEDA